MSSSLSRIVHRTGVYLQGGARAMAAGPAALARRILVLVAASGVSLALMTSTAWAGDSPSGFFWGSDGNGPVPSSSAVECASSSAPWLEPDTSNNGCGHYGGYVGEVGGYWSFLGCSGFSNAWSSDAAGKAKTNFESYSDGFGTAAYFFGGGPGMDPNYDGTTSTASAWGKKQAGKAVSLADGHSYIDQFIIFLDVEDPGNTGWNEEMSSCTHVQSTTACCKTSVDRATFNGFWDYIWNHSKYFIGAYASPGVWTGIFGSGSDSSLTGTSEWTADYAGTGGGCRNPAPTGWTQGSGSCPSNSANFFGGIGSGSDCALAWQWAGVSLGDFDQNDTNRLGFCK